MTETAVIFTQQTDVDSVLETHPNKADDVHNIGRYSEDINNVTKNRVTKPTEVFYCLVAD